MVSPVIPKGIFYMKKPPPWGETTFPVGMPVELALAAAQRLADRVEPFGAEVGDDVPLVPAPHALDGVELGGVAHGASALRGSLHERADRARRARDRDAAP